MTQRFLYSYVVDHDEGYAPNPVGGMCSLAYCKFSQTGRKRNLVEMVEEGDWVLGTGGKGPATAGHGRLIYAMRVMRKLPLSQYVSSPRYAGRADRFPEDKNTHGRFALLSTEFYYFGRNAIDIARIPHRHLPHRLEKRGPAYRADFSEEFIADFEDWIRNEFRVGIHGEPCGPRPPHWSTSSFRCRPRFDIRDDRDARERAAAKGGC